MALSLHVVAAVPDLLDARPSPGCCHCGEQPALHSYPDHPGVYACGDCFHAPDKHFPSPVATELMRAVCGVCEFEAAGFLILDPAGFRRLLL